jgi:hypothetical protein
MSRRQDVVEVFIVLGLLARDVDVQTVRHPSVKQLEAEPGPASKAVQGGNQVHAALVREVIAVLQLLLELEEGGAAGRRELNAGHSAPRDPSRLTLADSG